MTSPYLSLVAPAYNEQDNIALFHERATKALKGVTDDYEIVFVNDGSTDGTLETLIKLQGTDPKVAVVDLSRNYGKEIALTAGLDFARGQGVIPIDVDLQDPPELIPRLVEMWEKGFQVVNARRRSRQGETFLKKWTASLFYRFMQNLGGRVTVPPSVGDFRLIDRKALEAIKSFREHHRFMKGIFASVGFNQAFVEYDREPRQAGKTSFNYWRLWNFSLEGITSFSTLPLRVFTYVGLLISLISFTYGFYILLKALFLGDPVAGFPTLFVSITFIGSVQLIGLGIIGEYLGRIFNETKRRPLYFVNSLYGGLGDNADTAQNISLALDDHQELQRA